MRHTGSKQRVTHAQRTVSMLQHPAALREHHAMGCLPPGCISVATCPCTSSKQWDTHDQRVDATAT